MSGHALRVPVTTRFIPRTWRRVRGGLTLTRMRSFVAAAFLVVAAPSARQSIPVRRLGRPTATSAERLGPTVLLRGLSDGRVLVNDVVNRRVLLFSADLKSFTTVIDSSSPSTRVTVARAGTLIPARADTTWFVDFPAQSLIVIDPAGRIARTMAAPQGRDMIALAGGGSVGLDVHGRLVYRVGLAAKRETLTDGSDGVVLRPADSAALVRADFDTRAVDTAIKIASATTAYTVTTPNPRGGPAALKVVLSLLPVGDEWVVTSDGSIAVVRTRDYHIDWVGPDGARRSSPPMPFDRRPFTDDDKHRFMDSVTAAFDSARAHPQMTPTGLPIIVPDLGFVPLSEAPDFYPPIQHGGVKADLAGRIWILPRTSSHAQGGALYDVIDHDGRIVERVQLPADRTILGFGARGTVYLAAYEAGHTTIERVQ